MNLDKIKNGRFYTRKNPFLHKAFKKWFEKVYTSESIILEPFAGAGHIIDMLKTAYTLEENFKAYDIDPKKDFIFKRDTLSDYPSGYDIAITNPPYLAKNSATRKRLDIDFEGFDDLYKVALNNMLKNNDHIAAIIPESFITSELFQERLFAVISLTNSMFDDTDCPVCLALWDKNISDDFTLYSGKELIGSYKHTKKKDVLNVETSSLKIKFNSIDGQIGLRGIDNSQKASIYFCLPEEIPSKYIKPTSRGLTRIKIHTDKEFDPYKVINKANLIIDKFRKDTSDIFLTSFKGLRKDGKYRRRMDFKRARKILEIAIEQSV